MALILKVFLGSAEILIQASDSRPHFNSCCPLLLQYGRSDSYRVATTQDKHDEKESPKKGKAAQKIRDLDDLKKEVAMVSDDGLEDNGGPGSFQHFSAIQFCRSRYCKDVGMGAERDGEEVPNTLSLFCVFQTEHKMSIEEVCRKYNTDCVQVKKFRQKGFLFSSSRLAVFEEEGWIGDNCRCPAFLRLLHLHFLCLSIRV